MNSSTVPPRQSAVYRTVAICGTSVLIIAVLAFIWVMASWPQPPETGTTTKTHARERMEQDAWSYAQTLSLANRDGTLTEQKLHTLTVPSRLMIGPSSLTKRGDTTVVTFSTHAYYGSINKPEPLTACYQVTLASPPKSPKVAQVAAANCADRATAPSGTAE